MRINNILSRWRDAMPQLKSGSYDKYTYEVIPLNGLRRIGVKNFRPFFTLLPYWAGKKPKFKIKFTPIADNEGALTSVSIWYRSPDIKSQFVQQLNTDKPTEVVINDHYCSSDGELLYWVGLTMFHANENWCVRIKGWNIESVFMMLVSAVFGGGAGYLLAKWFGIGL